MRSVGSRFAGIPDSRCLGLARQEHGMSIGISAGRYGVRKNRDNGDRQEGRVYIPFCQGVSDSLIEPLQPISWTTHDERDQCWMLLRD